MVRRKAFLLLAVVAVLFLAGAVAVSAAPSQDGVSSGLPTVTPDEFSGKVNSTMGKVYSIVVSTVPYISVAVIAAGAILGIFSRRAWKVVVQTVLAIVLILWAPLILGTVINIVK